MSSTIRIDEVTLVMLNGLEKMTGEYRKKILRQALDRYQRDKIIEDINSHYEALRADPVLWQEELKERAIWEKADNDGLDNL